MGSYLERYAIAAAAALGPGMHVSITFRHAGATLWVASSSESSARCDRVEARDEDGPCIAAMRSMRTIRVADVATDGRWPRWGSRAEAEGFRWFAAVPGAVGDDAAVALNVYAGDAPLSDVERMVAPSLAALAADVAERLARTADGGEADEPSGRDLVERAVGVLMQAKDCASGQARTLLRTMAGAAGASLPTMARRLLEVAAAGGVSG